MFDNVNKFAVSVMFTNTQRDFRSEYLLGTCSVATSLVTSLEFNPICCGAMVCHLGQTLSSYVVITFIFAVALRRAVLQAIT